MAQPPQFKLNFDFLIFQDGFWDKPNLTIRDLVSSIKDPSNGSLPHQTWFKSKQTVFINASKHLFLYEEAKAIAEDPSLKKKPLKHRLCFHLSLCKVLHLYEEFPAIFAEIRSWITLVESSIKRTVTEATLSIG